jgi:hypothetical protein
MLKTALSNQMSNMSRPAIHASVHRSGRSPGDSQGGPHDPPALAARGVSGSVGHLTRGAIGHVADTKTKPRLAAQRVPLRGVERLTGAGRTRDYRPAPCQARKPSGVWDDSHKGTIG